MEEGMKFRISLVKGKWSKTKDYGNIDNCEYYVIDETDILKCSADKYGVFHENCGKDCELYKMLGKKGGDGSGNFGHSGRPGEVGGSGGGSVRDLSVYHGGSAREGEFVTYYTTNKEMAESYAGMYNDRFGGGGIVNESTISISNPASDSIISSEAKIAGIDNSDYTPASVFDQELHGSIAVGTLVNNLVSKGYDGAILTDIAYGANIEENVYVKFTNKKNLSNKGSESSGNFGHSGRPGEVGGSGGGGGKVGIPEDKIDSILEGYPGNGGIEEERRISKAFASEAGFDEKANIVSKEEFDALDKGTTIYRVTSQDSANEEMDGEYRASNGLYGSGIYFAEEGASGIARSGGTKTIAALSSDSNIMEYEDVFTSMITEHNSVIGDEQKSISSLADKFTGGNVDSFISDMKSGKFPEEKARFDKIDAKLNTVLRDPGLYGMSKGYDALRVGSMKYTLVLNRGKLIVDKSSLPNKKSIKGSESSGNFGHAGNPPNVGGSAGGGTFADLKEEYGKTGEPFDKENVQLTAYRVGETEDKYGRGVFFASDAEGAAAYVSLHEGMEVETYSIELDKALIAGHQNSVCKKFYGKTYSDMHYQLSRSSGSEGTGGRKLDQKIRTTALKLGYSGIVYTSPAPPAKMEVGVFRGSSISKKSFGKSKGSDSSGNYGHEGRPGFVGGSGGGGEGRFPPVWANGGGYVDQKEYRNYLVKEGSTPEAMKNIEDNLYTHSGSSEDMQKAADEKLASYWNDPNSVEGTTMRSMADLEEHAAMENNRHNISQASSRVDEVQKYSPDKITAANYEDASFTIGDSPRSDTYSSSFDMKLDEATGGLDAAKNQSLYRKTASGDSKRQILSYSQNGEGAVTNPITGGDQRIVPNSSIKLTELKSSGFRILSGYAQQRGRPGEAEVVLIRDSAKGMKGSESSGNFGHEGRPGVGVGGSGGGDGGAVNRDEEVKEWHENLSPKEQDIISSWMGEGYTDIQFAQMGHEDRRDKIADAKRFERVMDKGIVYEGQAYRGLNMNDSEFDKITNAKSMTLDTHQSATDNLDDCAKFAAGSNNSVVLSMRCNTAVNLSAISTEREVVIKKGTSYRALGKSSISLNVPETMVGFTRVPARTITATKIELEEIK